MTNQPQTDEVKLGLRLPRDVHERLTIAAAREDRSINSQIVHMIRAATSRRSDITVAVYATPDSSLEYRSVDAEAVELVNAAPDMLAYNALERDQVEPADIVLWELGDGDCVPLSRSWRRARAAVGAFTCPVVVTVPADRPGPRAIAKIVEEMGAAAGIAWPCPGARLIDVVRSALYKPRV